MNYSRQSVAYLLADYVLASFCWLASWYIRREIASDNPLAEATVQVYIRGALAGVAWVLLFAAFGLYRHPFRYSRIKELGTVLEASLLGVFLISFISFINDPYGNTAYIQRVIVLYLLLQFVTVGTGRLLLSSYFKQRLRSGRLNYPTLLVGQGRQAAKLLANLSSYPFGRSYQLQGYVPIHADSPNHMPEVLPSMGTLCDLPKIIADHKIRFVILAPDEEQYDRYFHILKAMQNAPVQLVAIPEMYGALLGKSFMLNELVNGLIDLDNNFQRPFTAFLKRVMDVVVSLIALTLLLPVFLVLSLLVWRSSPGPVFFRQERIGKQGHPFRILKFRTMFMNAEQQGPALSQENDPRITPIGRFLRKTRLDETPQFWNVLVGDMSLVGPRPERQHWIEQIVEKAPEYLQLMRVKPGITSLGQVRYGYASNVDEMVERLRYDLLYLQNMTLSWDVRIMFYTVQIIFQRRGK